MRNTIDKLKTVGVRYVPSTTMPGFACIDLVEKDGSEANIFLSHAEVESLSRALFAAVIENNRHYAANFSPIWDAVRCTQNTEDHEAALIEDEERDMVTA